MLKAVVLTRLSFAIPLLFAVVSCSQVMRLNCEPHSWHGLGVRDGAKGLSHRVADKYERRCNHQSTEFDREAYDAGFVAGHAEYCTGQNGFNLGLSGAQARRVCMNHDAAVFKNGYKAGRALREAVVKLEQTKHPELYGAGSPNLRRRSFHVEHVVIPSIESTRYYNLAAGRTSLSRLEFGSNSRISSPSRLPTLVEKCEKAIRSAEEKGYFTEINCSAF
ncbi:MAG: DUF2799 domain-containing protein [Gammaproteobacteria bacterium]|nr:DUF2799 domain-containing protein [Gammaproteobacteria bacterium]